MPPNSSTYVVVAQSDERAVGTTFGPFSSREQAEACVIALASRTDIKSATINIKQETT